MNYINNYKKWLASDAVDADTKSEIEALLAEAQESGSDDKLIDRFENTMTFGTAGLRGIMRAGLNGMNVYTVRYATQGFAAAILQSGEDIGSGVCICHDCRINSRLFAEEAASVMAANGIHVNIFDDLRPTPELSFAVRDTGAIAGINITASHNTREYNGYKAYWSDGAQLSNYHVAAVSGAIAALDIFDDIKRMDYQEAVKSGLITIIGQEVDERYLGKVFEQSVGQSYVSEVADDFKIVYTPFHGCGYKMVPEILRRIGIKNLICEPDQMKVDGTFPTVASPNPENVEGFERAIALAKREDADLIIGTDPDSDRCGVAVRDNGEYIALSGNQIGTMLIDYLITVRRERGILPENAGVIKSIVTSQMVDRVCDYNDVHIAATLTGFRFIGQRMKEFEDSGKYSFIFGFEEAIGFLAGTYARDKDAVVASMLVAEMACWYKSRGMNLAEGLESVYQKYGYYREKTISHVFEGYDAQERMTKRMAEIRAELPTELGYPVKRVRDYLSGEVTDLATGEKSATGLDKSDVLYFELEEGCVSTIRPSGTEPKIKLYLMSSGETAADAEAKLQRVMDASLSLLK